MTAARVWGRYEIHEELGGGGSAIVYRAIDQHLGREVALKVLHGHADASAFRRLEREAKVAAKLSHPSAVEVFEIGELEGRAFIAMELVRGESLASALAGRAVPLGPAVARALGGALADVLAAAHAIGLVHRDLKPSNIFVDGASWDRVRVVDFGLAFMMSPRSQTLGRLTAHGQIVGTPAYMAPEQADDAEIGPPADIYALGCLLYEVVAGRPPFLGSVPKLLAAHVFLPPIPFADLELADPAPGWLEAAIFEMLAKAPADRPCASALAVLFAQSEPVTLRSARNAPRSERRPPASGDTDAPAEPVRIAAVGLGPGECDALRAAGAVLVEREEAELVLVALDASAPLERAPSAPPVVGVHPAPSPRLIAEAIRAGMAFVIRISSDAAPNIAKLRALARRA